MYPRTLEIWFLNVHGCSMLEGKRQVIARMLVEQKFDVLALSETELRGKGECEFGSIYLVVA